MTSGPCGCESVSGVKMAALDAQDKAIEGGLWYGLRDGIVPGIAV
jgi:hypothetical protein